MKEFPTTGKSREHIVRCFKKYLGKTPSEYVNDLRLTYVADMLKNSGKKITDIVFESGFNNVGWASDRFKAKFGVCMREYRKST